MRWWLGLPLCASLLMPQPLAFGGDYGCAQPAPRYVPHYAPGPDCGDDGALCPPVIVKVYVQKPCKKHCGCKEPPRGEVVESLAIRRISLPQRSAELTFARQQMRLGPPAVPEAFEADCKNSKHGAESGASGDLSDRQRIERLERGFTEMNGKIDDLLTIVKQQQQVLNHSLPPR